MLKKPYLEFYNYFGKFREPPVEGVFSKISKTVRGQMKVCPFLFITLEQNKRGKTDD
jgi:hypothetical protein